MLTINKEHYVCSRNMRVACRFDMHNDCELNYVLKRFVEDGDCHNNFLFIIYILCSKVFIFNVKGGKKMKGITAVLSYYLFASSIEISEAQVELSRIVDIGVRKYVASYLVVDDTLDSLTIRRLKACCMKRFHLHFT